MMKSVEIKKLLDEKILSLNNMLTEFVVKNYYVGIHNLPYDGKWLCYPITYKNHDYELYFMDEVVRETFMESLIQLNDDDITFNGLVRPVWKDI